MNKEDPEVIEYNESLDITQIPMFNRTQLSIYNGIDDQKIYLAIKGYVYDVSSNAKSYGPGKSYNKLVAKDSTRLLGLNKLVMPENDVNDQKQTWDTDDFTEKQHETVNKWVEFFRKRYRIVGLIAEHDL